MHKHLCVLVVALGASAILCTNSISGDFFQISYLEGHAFVMSSEGTREIRSGDVLVSGDVIRTGPGSNMGLRLYGLEEKSVVISENSSFMVGVDRGEAIKLTKGSLEAWFAKSDGQSIGVSTPTVFVVTLGADFVVSYGRGVSQVTVHKGLLNATSRDLISQESKKNSVALVAGQRIEATRIGLGPINESVATTQLSVSAIKLNASAAVGARYVVSSCRPQDNMSGCSDQKNFRESNLETDREDYAISVGDAMTVPLRAALHKADSLLELVGEDVVLRFKGPMIVCVDYDAKNDKLVVEPLQAVTDTITERINEKTVTTWTSRNRYGLKNTRIQVREGEVVATVPWTCRSCFDTKTFLLETGDCRVFYHQPLEREEDEDVADLFKVVVNPPFKMDQHASTRNDE